MSASSSVVVGEVGFLAFEGVVEVDTAQVGCELVLVYCLVLALVTVDPPGQFDIPFQAVPLAHDVERKDVEFAAMPVHLGGYLLQHDVAHEGYPVSGLDISEHVSDSVCPNVVDGDGSLDAAL